MELIEKNGPYLCLNMIVKNEGHIIKDTLTKLLKKVPEIDYWVISDTGSTDKTKEIISDFFKERNINGELFDDVWKDFGHNRTLALEHAFGKSKYLMVFDADDEICGDFVLPNLVLDSYNFQFGDANGTSYIRTQIINNKKKWKYVGVLHEIITCSEQTNGMDIIKGKYYTISGKSGSRSQDQNKYQKDALVLENAYEEAVKNNDGLYNRYGFYCANSYYDSGKWADAIKWYKITLGNKNWDQEKYVACHRLHNCYNALNQKETGLYYLVKSFSYDKERAECLYELVSYYCCNEMNEVAYSYYNIVKSFYNEKYLKYGLNDKLFLDVSKANLFLPYYMILVSDKVQDHDTSIQMYRIIFTKKHIERSRHFIGNMLYNLQFFIERVKDDSDFLRLFQEYIKFLVSIEYPVYDHDFMVKYEKYGINVPKFSESVFSLDDCLKSKNILLYSGYSPFKWNYTFSINNALGGSETAITCLTKNFPKDYTIYVVGEVEEETVENMRYVHFNNLKNLIKTTAFHTIIVSRYLNFYELYRNFSAYQTFIWGHDITLYAYGTDLSVEGILSKWASKITGCICQTEWHKNLFLSSFPQLKDKITTINNGINVDLFNLRDISKLKKVINRFIYTSCSERGLYKLVQLWPSILENLPDAELLISSYNNFPKSEEDVKILEIINKTPSIKHMGKLNRTELYNLMASAEYWLYPSYFQETSCITSLELLASEVICLYYPIAGLVNTVGDYGIQISEGNEIDALLSLSIKKKNELKRKGKEYALSCSWQNRVIEWSKLLFLQNLSIIEKRMFDLYETISMPQAHTNILKKISETFTPNVIYDIGASTLHWTKAAKNIWPNSEFCAFDAIEEAEKLYKSKNIKYNIGVISDQDNKIVKFYENKENPAGNSYYKEIGHPNSVNVYPENSYIERKSMTLETIVKCNNFLLPDIVKIDVQGAELDILKGGQTIINKAKYLIIELQNVEYNRGAPLENVTIEYLQSNGWEIVEAKFSNNGPDADYLFINTNYRADKILNNDYIIKIINLEKRSDRKNLMASKLSEQNITNYEFFKAVDGNLLEPSSHIQNLFKNNDFNYRKGIIGCALSHYTNWNNLINDSKNSYYVILEDDIKLTSNFNILLDKCISIIKSQNIEYALIGGNQIKEEFGADDNIVFSKITQPICSGAYGYIISKKACIKLVNYLNKNGINRAIDHSDLYTTCLDMYRINKYLVTTRAYQIHGETDTDIQLNYNCLIFDSVPTYTVSFVDWWSEEYCGGIFDNQNNYFTNLLRNYYNVQIVEPNQNPDILFYSVFGNNHLTLNAGRKVFYSGESISQDNMADFNITFDNDNYNNCRLPLWICYLNDTIINDYNNKIQNKIAVPQKSKFCSIISQQDNVSNTRSEIVNKLSKYKRVDCGGKFLNNIGYVVPRGINCSGKIEHNNNYKFVIAFENKDYPGYVTEKICDAYKSKCIPIYWGTKDVVKDFNPSTFINANNFANLDELVKYIIKVDNDDKWYASFFKDPIFSNKWLDTFNDINKTFYKNLADKIIGKDTNLLNVKTSVSVNNNKEKWVVYGPDWIYNLIKEYINNLNLRYCVKYVTTVKEIQTINPSKILFINKIHDNSVFNVFKNIEISILNIDSMYISNFFNDILEMISLYPNIKIYDYSLKNIEVLQKYNIRTEFLEYIYDEKEINSLKEINNQAKTYDFGIIGYYKDVRCSYRRKHIVDLLRSKGYTVNVACGFDRERDVDLGKCKIILNIHCKNFTIECRTFEHLRCNRLLYAGFKILSEVSYIDNDFISKYKENIKFIKYDDFENITRENIDKFNFISAKNNDYNCQKEIGIFNYESSRVDYKIEFGLDDNKIDITYKVIALSLNKEFIEIPTDDVLRAELYGDPCWGVVKSIYITTKDGSVTKCKDNHPIILDWNGILIKNPNFKYKLSACLLIKNETENLNDWIEHYINEGVEHFFITSNNSTDGIDNFILNSEYKNMITLITDNSDIDIYNDQGKHHHTLSKNFYNIIRNSTEWCILVDIDEFMYGKNGYTLSSFIDTLDQDIGCFYVYWNIFKPTLDSENNISDKFSLKKSCKRINLDLISDLSYEIKFASKFGKSIFRTSMLQDHTQLWIHKVSTSGKIITNYGNISNYKYDNADDIYWSELNYTKVNVALNHYAIRNKKDYDNKLSQLENTHRYPFVKGLLDICELDNKYIIEDRNILNL
jgi:FkbM family methyltransferase